MEKMSELNLIEKVTTSIEDLPQEVLEMIFAYLDDWKELISLTTTSKCFNMAISQSKKFLSETNFKLNPSNINEEITRQYSNVEIESVNVIVATKKMIQINRNIKQLKLKNITIVNRLDLFNFLKMSIFDQIEHLELEDIQFCDKKSFVPLNQRLIWNHLDQLSVISTNTPRIHSTNSEWILNHIGQKNHFRMLKIHRGRNISYRSDHLIKFINKLDNLKCLDLEFVDFSSSTLLLQLNSKFALDELKLQDMPFASPSSHRMISSLFKQGKRLTILENCNGSLVYSLLKAYEKFLEYFHLDVNSLPGGDFSRNMKEKNLVRTLELSGESKDSNVCMIGQTNLALFQMHFMHTDLHITYVLLLEIHTARMNFFFRALKKLTVDFFGVNLGSKGMHFANIRELEITNFRYKQLENLRSFMKRHYLDVVKVGVIRGFEKYGDRIFKALYAIVSTADVFEIFDGKKTHRKTKEEIEMREFGKIFDKNERMKFSKKWNDNLQELDQLYDDSFQSKMFYNAFITKDEENRFTFKLPKGIK